jgi:hypothetical protein
MKTWKLYLLAICTFLLFFAGCIVNISIVDPVIVPETPSTFKLIAGALLAVYEVVVRVIPTINDYSVVSWIIKALKKVSDTLNRSH